MADEEKKAIKVLLVDDEEHFRERLSLQLSVRGYTVFNAGDGLCAIEIVEKENPDVVVLDHKMPGMDGMQTFKEIRKLRPLAEVIMLTGHATANTALEAMKLGAFDYIMKPVDLEELILKLEDAGKKRAIREKYLQEKWKK